MNSDKDIILFGPRSSVLQGMQEGEQYVPYGPG